MKTKDRENNIVYLFDNELYKNQEIGHLNQTTFNLHLYPINTMLSQHLNSESQEQAEIDALELMIQHYDYLATKFTRLRDESMELKESLFKGVWYGV